MHILLVLGKNMKKLEKACLILSLKSMMNETGNF